MLTNGLIARLDGPFIGRRHDTAILYLSEILDEMSRFLDRNGRNFAVYGDPGYSNQQYVKVGYKNYGILTENQKQFNKMMSSLRISVEYGFGNIVREFAFLDFEKSQMLYKSHLKKFFFVAAFLTNVQCCMRGRNQISDIFQSYVPTLEEYLQ